MTDLLYVVKGDNPGCRYSLRSVAKHASNLGRLVVAGTDIPSWLSDDVVRVEVDSPYDRKQKNILYAVLEALRRKAVGRCLYSSDDHYMTEPTELDAHPVYGQLRGYPPLPDRRNAIDLSVYDTGKLLASYGLPCDLRVDGHWNTWIHPEDLPTVETIARGYELTPYGYEPTTLFVAAASAAGRLATLTLMHDFKLTAEGDATADFDDLAKRGVMSATSLDKCPRFRAWLDGKFPDPCRWEADR